MKQTHELIINKNGTHSLRHIESGEVMHSSIGPREEATLLYVEQSRLAARLAPEGSQLVLFDIGLGAATNALAALHCASALEHAGRLGRPLNIVSFETDLSGVSLALENASKLPFFDGFESAVATLIHDKCWKSTSGKLTWSLREGSFLEQKDLPLAELIYFDFYSPRTCPDLWSVATFEFVRRHCTPNSCLFTYSSSTRVRLSLLLAGFSVGYGRSTGAKYETTTAAIQLTDLESPLDARWLDRLSRSHAAEPYGALPERFASRPIREIVASLAQFKGTSSL